MFTGLFLDEIGTMPLNLQPKLLRIIEQGNVARLGDVKSRPIDVRIIAATNRNLVDEVKNNNFALDLYYRLSVVEISLPPLRERMDDIPELIELMISRISRKLQKPHLPLTEDVLRILLTYHWPGNLRELENVIERALVVCDKNVIDVSHLPPSLLAGTKSNFIGQSLDNLERQVVLEALRESDFNILQASRTLKVSRSRLYRKINKYNVDIRKARNDKTPPRSAAL